MPKYVYNVIIDAMEKIYFDNTNTEFFKTEEDRKNFNAELIVDANNEQESEKIRIGMTDTRMWKLNRIEE